VGNRGGSSPPSRTGSRPGTRRRIGSPWMASNWE